MNDPNSRDNIKDYFVTGAIPTQEQFEELIDAFVHRHHESEQRVGLGTPTPMNTLDVDGSVVIGSEFAGNREAPDQGLLVEGDVGIGTGDPGAKLHVNGDVIIENGGLTIGEFEVINAQGEWHDPEALKGPQGDTGPQGPQGPAGPQGPQGPPGNGGTSKWIDGEKTVITEVNVGINTADPETSLHVAGFVTKQQVAFTLTKVSKVESNFQLSFTSPFTNEGAGWQEDRHSFVVPENGTYFFQSNIIINDMGDGGQIRMIKNGDLQNPLFAIWDGTNMKLPMYSSCVAVPLIQGDILTFFTTSNLDDKQFEQFNLTGYRL